MTYLVAGIVTAVLWALIGPSAFLFGIGVAFVAGALSQGSSATPEPPKRRSRSRWLPGIGVGVSTFGPFAWLSVIRRRR
jgi:hypothetical protein